MALPPTPSPASSASPAEVCRESSKIQEELSSVSPSQSSLLTNALCTKAHPWRVAIGFLGIQFAWALQMGQVSPLLERLGSQPWLTSLIWAAGPVTGVLVQPIVGALSDATTSWLGRRRPFLILGTVLVALSLMMMPNAAIVGAWLQQVATPLTRLGFITPQAWEQFPFGLLVAAMLLWVLDASINITQGPYRALVPDVFNTEGQTKTFSLMSVTIGLGSIAAFLIGFVLKDVPTLFYLGAVVMVVFMGLTIMTTPETPLLYTQSQSQARSSLLKTLVSGVTLTTNQWRLCLAHSATWFGLMCLFIFFSVYVPKAVFGATNPASNLYQQGVQWASLGFAALNTVCFLVAFGMDSWSRRWHSKGGAKAVHSVALLAMALALTGLCLFPTPWAVLGCMALMGLGWATTLSLPFAMVTQDAPKGQEGMLMGVFNIFVAAPGVLASVVVGPLMSRLHATETLAFGLGAVAMLLAWALLQTFVWQPSLKETSQ